MLILIFEDNLMWSSRLKRTISGLGHESKVIGAIPEVFPVAEAAIVNLGSSAIDPSELVPKLRAAGIYVIAHAGHKETDLKNLSKELGCHRLVSNSELTFKLSAILANV